jgi:hypothetical protein
MSGHPKRGATALLNANSAPSTPIESSTNQLGMTKLIRES